ncbi:uncharacterized protein [Primulina eburnea]|uniref:uncharacterized protein isoform X2 n=1 Tax=Primulina eburnea TaxID=1245227 RepID=UPI003C6C654C
MGELGVVNSDGAVLKEEERLVWSLGTTPPPDPASFSEDCLSAAEEAVAELVNCIHPTLDSDENRRDVNDHLQKLIKTRLNCEVFPYGSVPLKTYLPDGDIDSTVLKGPNVEDSLAHDVLAVLKKEDHKEDTDYQVMDTQFIDTEALYRFLDYYSQFDWDNYCISLKGPVRKSSLPNIVVSLFLSLR